MSDKNSKSDNRLIEERREKLQGLRESGFNYPSTIAKDSSSKDIIDEHDSLSKEDIEASVSYTHLPLPTILLV